MINTYLNEKIEPRVGDIITNYNIAFAKQHLNDISVCFPITGIYMDRRGYYMTFEGGFSRLPAEGYTLLHRPFQAGDEVEYLDIGAQENYWVPHHPLINKDLFEIELEAKNPNCQLYKGTTYKQRLRHKNPALRDHPDYKEG